MEKQLIVVIHGPSGSGKSTVAELVKVSIKPSVHLGSDRLRFHITDFKIDKIRGHFDLTRDIMMGMVSDYIDKGFNIVCEDQFRKEHVEKLRDIANKKGIDILSYEVNLSNDIRKSRIASRNEVVGKPMPTIITNEGDWQYEEYMNNKDDNSTLFDTGELDAETIAAKIIEDIKI
jgi:predicted kinase